ncbi:hypothetical protein AOLI_G00071170 [Acnodon oligacanthus]
MAGFHGNKATCNQKGCLNGHRCPSVSFESTHLPLGEPPAVSCFLCQSGAVSVTSEALQLHTPFSVSVGTL